jgi:hypothetical protein
MPTVDRSINGKDHGEKRFRVFLGFRERSKFRFKGRWKLVCGSGRPTTSFQPRILPEKCFIQNEMLNKALFPLFQLTTE